MTEITDRSKQRETTDYDQTINTGVFDRNDCLIVKRDMKVANKYR